MKSVISFLLVITSVFVFGQQNENHLIGKWEYQDIYEKEKIDSTGIKMLKMLFSNMTIQFNDDGLYKALIMGKDDQGSWTSEGDKTIALESDKGSITKMELIELNENQLVFSLRKNAFIMSKAEASETDEIVAKEMSFNTVKATNKQVAKKWYLKSKESSRVVSDKVKEATNEVLKGSYMEFSKNGKYEVQILKIKEKGKWEFGEENRSIVTSKDGNKKVWKIIGISDLEMILIQGKSNEKWIFGITE